ncbi:class I SAM-dependent methyltransferase [Aggregicoccus sp. 17bor-14]|uniref:class I SAM-dependent methyltransferase n=1 Tax=Myxococcaceae TaxID=31 RepID=UPI00129C7CDE|nr:MULTISPECIES: methyltransferase domain-containing protein [Myxococcaceae]MBF5044400.1 class I SAM-dependent methyltransferase [Simulacricoccus sp. 17bor-14]MRI90147.1 class I SAM-dependent methyltransferase [Aggregicoccus sp. 17bor-14]
MTPVHLPSEPSPWIVRFAHLVRAGGRVLDVAAGEGRHAAFFLSRGHAVTAVDRTTDALERLKRCDVRRLDLEDGAPWSLGGGWDAIVVTNYLHRPLLPALPGALAPGGVLLYETFAQGHERYGRPSRPEFLLRPGELLEAFVPPLTPVAYEHGLLLRARPCVIQRLVAVAGSADPLPLES